MATIESICKYNKYGFCKFLKQCRRQQRSENCSETTCNIINCLKRHPKNCKFYDLYKCCKFGEYCAFAHRENPLVIEINALRINQAVLNEELNDRGNEVMDLREKVEALEHLVQGLVSRVENITTPTKKGTKKRRRVKQAVKPSPTKKDDDGDVDHHYEEPTHEGGALEVSDQESDHGEREITVDEIMKMYEST